MAAGQAFALPDNYWWFVSEFHPHSGGKIQATVRRPLLHKFTPLLAEGCVYKMVYFNVVPNVGQYRATSHEYKLVFLFKTSVVKKESDSIPMFGLSLVAFNEVLGYGDNHQYLIDVMGVLTGVMPERQYEKDGKVTTMVVMELTDPYGKLECALFGEYVDELRNFLREGGNIQVIVVVQLARVKTFRGKIVIQNSLNATRLLFNPDIPEAISFRNSIAEHGVIDVEPLAVVLDNSKEGMENDFMKLHPRISLYKLNAVKEDGMFVILAKIVDLVHDGPWFYLSCKCNRSVTIQSTLYYCESCMVPVLHVCPRYKVKVEVVDESSSAVFVLFDRDVSFLLKKTCEELLIQSVEDVTENGYPTLLNSLIGQRMIFKVETRVDQVMQFEGSYAVRRVCVDEDIIAMFDLSGSELSPTKALFAPPFPNLSSDFEELGKLSRQVYSDIIPTAISLGDDEIGLEFKSKLGKRKMSDNEIDTEFKLKCGKRKLEDDFDSDQVVHADAGDKVDPAVEERDDVDSVHALVTVPTNEG